MLRFFRHIRKKLIEKDNVCKYLLYTIGEILLVVIGNFCPVRDYLSVEKIKCPNPHRAIWYGICQNPFMAMNHIAYLTARGSLLNSNLYRYIVPTGQPISAKSLIF